MAMNLIDRPGLAHEELGHPGLSAAGSAALHAALCLVLLATLRIGPDNAVNEATTALLPRHLVWMPHVDVGGGRSGGGDRTPAPARRVRQIGTDPTTVPSQPTPSLAITDTPPEELTTIPARPMADATQTLAGVIESHSAGTTSLGPGTSGVGDFPGSDRGGLGTHPGPGFGPGASRGGPGVTMPTILEQVSPTYTADAMRARVQGSVWIECVVMPDGSVGDLRIMRSLDRRFGLDEEAVKAARRWRFRPGRLNGQPVPVVVTIELMFSVR
jgi:TonB family protein